MTSANQIVSFALYFLLFITLQVLLFLQLSLFEGMALCFVYVSFLLMLPYQVSHISLMLLGFATGLVVDIFYNTNGIHAASSVLLGFVRPYVVNLLTPRGGYDDNASISIPSLGFRWFFSYASILILTHHLLLFLIWTAGYGNILLTLGKTIASSAFTLTIVILIQYFIYTPKKA